jgi:hypothetical protein
MRRSGFRKKADHRPLKAGKKTKAWTNARNKLKVVFQRWGITACEECFTTEGLGFAHLSKRRNLKAEDLGDPNKVVLLCNQDHWKHEQKGESRMAIELQKIIDRRAEREEATA